jgi:hypothetical protein
MTPRRAFAFNIAEDTVLNLDENLAKTLNSEQVRQAMSTTLTMLALTGKTNTGQPDESKKLAEALLTKAGQAAGKEFLEQLKKTPEVSASKTLSRHLRTHLPESGWTSTRRLSMLSALYFL